MLLYHFPLTSNSATPNLENKGLKSDYVIGGQGQFVSGGKLSSYCSLDAGVSTFLLVNNIIGEYSLCLRHCLPTNLTPENYCCIFLSNNLNIWWYNGSWYVNANNVSVKRINPIRNKWNDIIVTCKDSQISFYINEILQHSFTASSTDGKCYIGLNKSNCLYQDIRIYDHVLSQQEIKDYSKALVLHYPLNGSELGNVVKDCSGFGNDGKTTNVLRYDDGSPRSKKSVYFGGNVDINTNVNEIILKDEFCICAWIKYSGESNVIRGVLGYLQENGGVAFSQTRLNGSLRFFVQDNVGSVYAIDYEEFIANKWFHFAYVKQSTQCYLYVNGELYKTLQNVVFAPLNTYLNLGRAFLGDQRYWKGNVSDLRIYASALSESDIKALYNQPISLGNSLNAIYYEESNTNDVRLHKSGVVAANSANEGDSINISINGITAKQIKED